MTGGNCRIYIDEFNLEHPEEAVKYSSNEPIPDPNADHVRVRLTMRPVHPADIAGICGAYIGFQPESFPATPGIEGVGVVDKNGAGCTQHSIGQRVLVFLLPSRECNGTWQKYLVVPESTLVAIPDDMPDHVAAQIVVNPMTAWALLKTLAAPRGEYVVQNAAASVLGRLFIQFAKHIGVKTIDIVRRREHIDALKQLGADEVICSADKDVVQRVWDITGGKGAWGAVDTVAGNITGTMAQCVRGGGAVYVYGALSGVEYTVPVFEACFRDVTVHGFWLVTYLQRLGDTAHDELMAVIELLRQGIAQPHSGREFKLEDAAEAITETLRENHGGKCLLVGP